jgi:predicted lactoylglutathione lyase
MIHVPDVRATMDWYASIGFKVVRYNEEDGETN